MDKVDSYTHRPALKGLTDRAPMPFSFEALAERIYTLSVEKGYTQAMIKTMLMDCGIERIAIEIINDLISYHSKRKNSGCGDGAVK